MTYRWQGALYAPMALPGLSLTVPLLPDQSRRAVAPHGPTLWTGGRHCSGPPWPGLCPLHIWVQQQGYMQQLAGQIHDGGNASVADCDAEMRSVEYMGLANTQTDAAGIPNCLPTHLFQVSGQLCRTLYLPLNLLKPIGRAEKGKLLLMKFVQLLSSSPEFCHMLIATPLWNTFIFSCRLLPLVLAGSTPLTCCSGCICCVLSRGTFSASATA